MPLCSWPVCVHLVCDGYLTATLAFHAQMSIDRHAETNGPAIALTFPIRDVDVHSWYSYIWNGGGGQGSCVKPERVNAQKCK